MRFEVLLTEDALRDLEELHDYILQYDDPAKADHVVTRLEKVFADLATDPGRGTYPKELLALGIREYRQVYFKPYRVIYRIDRKRVYIYLVIDGRRDMQGLLARRLFGV